jgi:RimJ/RimL family protein N-acetyltransferase
MLETERLILRPLCKNDIDAIYRMRSDADIMRYIREPQNRDESANWVELVSSRWAAEQIGFCAIIEKSSHEFAGWCGLWQLKETGEIEIGYAVGKQFWGKGYASEAATEFLAYAFERLEVEKIVAVARPENAASRRVMEKLGMHYDYTGEFYGRDLVHYSISREKFYA